MNTKQIDCVLELSSTLNFTRAAENLFISQPSLTYQVQCLEDEIGFKIFDRTAKNVALTPAGTQFCISLRKIKNDIKAAIEEGQNIGSKYSSSLNVCIPMRSCIFFLPQIIRKFEETMPTVALNIKFVYDETRLDLFLRKEQDILFAREQELNRFQNVALAPLFRSRLYMILRKDDPLAQKEVITSSDLSGRTFMVGGGSTPEMIIVQNRIIKEANVNILNCPDHETALINVAAGRGITLTPGFTNDHTGEFAYIPFDCKENCLCVLGYHKDDTRESVRYFIELCQAAYSRANTIPL
ncbi:MAG: LysR family transcriptional regulator [Clostridia bacterium]|nr:LysR family transcriptional regulator [Clostridia bacterium]